MKITEAFWEKKNLLKNTVEIIIENKDTIPEIENSAFNKE